MAMLPRKPKLYPKLTDIVAQEKEEMVRRKAIFDTILKEADEAFGSLIIPHG
jgi:hypothetical protein